MTFDEYQQFAKSTAVYPDEYKVIYPTLGLTGEAGEVAEKVKKYIRDGINISFGLTPSETENLKKELGDVLWYVSALASDLDISLEDIAETNVSKLTSRVKYGKIQGSGDDR